MFSVKSFLPRTLLGRSLMILITPILLIQVIATFVFFDRHWGKMTMRLAYSVAGETALIASEFENDPSPQQMRDIIGYASQHLDLLVGFKPGAAIEQKSSNFQPDAWKSHMAETLRGQLETSLQRPFFLAIDDDEKWIIIDVQLSEGVLSVMLPQRRLFSSSGYIFLLWMIGSSIVLLAIAILFMRNQIRPIRKLAAAAERFGKGRDVAYFKPEGAKEVRQAGESFLDMHKRIKRQIEQRTTMLAGVSHDLRTPLTRLKLQLAMLPDNKDVKEMKGDIQQMEKMIEGYLDFVRGEGDEEAQPVSLSATIDKATDAARRHGLNIESSVGRDTQLMLRPVAFERCLMNIITNAGQYGKHIWLSTQLDGKYLNIIIEDDGPGIPADQYDDVFRPFYRVDSSRNAATGGVGLGLPIAMEIVHGHGGKIWLEESNHGGLKVMIRLPV
jgi:two-component system, OmpR family, osmolarity sensor histidine kinase EnvZ